MDLGSIFGLALGAGAVVLGQLLLGGDLGQLFQFTAALVVIAGTLGGMLVSFPIEDVSRALGRFSDLLSGPSFNPKPTIDELVAIATIARKDGLLAMEPARAKLKNAFLKRTIKLVMDGVDAGSVRAILDAEVVKGTEEGDVSARVLESGGAYAPAVGILGSVLGLIHVLSILNEPAKLGQGIAAAFVATLYGIGLANLLLLPWASRVRRISESQKIEWEIVRAGVLGIQEGLSPQSLKDRLEAMLR